MPEQTVYIASYLTDEVINRVVQLIGAYEYGEGYRVVEVDAYYVRQELVGGQYQAPRVPGENDVVGVEMFTHSWLAGKEYHKTR